MNKLKLSLETSGWKATTLVRTHKHQFIKWLFSHLCVQFDMCFVDYTGATFAPVLYCFLQLTILRYLYFSIYIFRSTTFQREI